MWVNSRYASEKKAYTGAGPAFKKWIQQFTAHNEKLGYNSSVIKGGFVKQEERIGLPESSRYNHFNDIYDKAFSNARDYSKVLYRPIQVNEIVRPQVAGPDASRNIDDFEYAGKGLLIDDQVLMYEIPRKVSDFVDFLDEQANHHEKKYLMAQLNAFATSLSGVRIPDFSG